jgi:kinesin family protein 4/21/27
VIGTQDTTRKSFTYDFVYGPQTSQSQIYKDLAAPLVTQFLEGYNGTILAYGQTYSGKTYTMGSNVNDDNDSETQGIIPRVFKDIFNSDNQSDGMEHIFKVNFLEIYQEQVIAVNEIKDLLNPSSNRDISVRETRDGSIILSGITEKIVRTPEDMMECLVLGSQSRSTGDTLMHAHSSRSHAIFTITLEKIAKLTHDPQMELSAVEPVVVQRSKLHLVDLAGSERLKRTGAEGVRLKESVKINSGLLALGNVISILGDEKQEPDKHVPYRDSKLTRLLQDSLGGNSQTIMLACVSPLESDMDETINTLKYAYRARKIQNKPVLNTVDQIALERTNMQHKIDQLEDKLKGLERHGVVPSTMTPEMIDFDNEQWMQYFMEQLKTRTIRGANALKALEKANAENELLKKQLEARNNERNHSPELQSRTEDIEKDYNELKERASSWKGALQELLEFCLKLVKAEIPSQDQISRVKTILRKHYPSENIEESADIVPPLMNHVGNTGASTRAPSTNSVARSHRRKRLGSDEGLADDLHLKPLETELRESRRYLGQLEEELARTKIILQQNEAISLESSKEITRLMHLNDSLRERLTAIDPNADKEHHEILSVKAVSEIGIQTGETSSIITVGDLATETSTEKLVDELAHATKAKVDLLKELSKSNKDSEKQRHLHADQMQKLERELDLKDREINRLQDEIQSREHAKEKMRDDFERKLRNQENQLVKHKSKLKELEKSLKYNNPDRKLVESQQEIEKLQHQVQTFKKRVKEDLEKFAELEARKAKEIFVLNKQLEDEMKKTKQIEAKAEMIRKQLDRKVEENSALTRRAKELSLSSIPTPKKSKPERKEAYEIESPKHTGVTSLSEISLEDSSIELQKCHARLDEIEKLLETGESSEEEMLRLEKSDLILQVGKLRSQLAKQSHVGASSPRNSQPVWDSSDYDDLFRQFPPSDSLNALIGGIHHLPDYETKNLVCECLRQIVDGRNEISRLEEQRKEQEANLSHEKEQVEILEKKTQRIVRSYEKKIAVLEKVFAY